MVGTRVGRVQRQLLPDEGRFGAIGIGAALVDARECRIKRGRFRRAQVHRERHRVVRPTTRPHHVSVANNRVDTSCNGGLSKIKMSTQHSMATTRKPRKPRNAIRAPCLGLTVPRTTHSRA